MPSGPNSHQKEGWYDQSFPFNVEGHGDRQGVCVWGGGGGVGTEEHGQCPGTVRTLGCRRAHSEVTWRLLDEETCFNEVRLEKKL